MWIVLGRLAALPRRARLGIPLLLGSLLVAGCTAGSPPRGLPPRTPSTTSRVTATPSPSPTMSAGEQVVAVVREFIAALDAAESNGDTSRIEAVTYPTCTCRKVVVSIHKAFANGGRNENARWSLPWVTLFGVDGREAIVDATFALSAYKTLDRGGAVVATYPSATNAVSVDLQQVKGRWLIVGVSNLVKH